MKPFTVKDFVTYNNPCFSCGENIIFTFGEAINPVIDGKECKVELITSYSDSLSLIINLNTNSFHTTNTKVFKKYLKTKNIFLKSKCSKCNTYILSSNLIFDHEKHFIKPAYLRQEFLKVYKDGLRYSVFSSDDGSILNVQDLKTGKNVLDIAVEPELFLYRIKTKEKLINKLKTYILFS